MANFQRCLQHVFRLEGGSNHKVKDTDWGGLTIYGIASKYQPPWVLEKMQAGTFTKADAAKIYYTQYWKKWINLDDPQIPDAHAYLLFDLAVWGNSGVNRLVRRILNDLGYGPFTPSGTIGQEVARVIAGLDQEELSEMTQRFVTQSRALAAATVARTNARAKAAKEVANNEIFQEGWANRIAARHTITQLLMA